MTANKELININKTGNENWEQLFEKQKCVAPFVDIYETDDNYFMNINMPGVKRENVKVKIEGDSLLIFGKVNYEEISNRKYVLNESGAGNYFRRFNISESIEQSKIEAKYENGQLIMTLPKNDYMKPRDIDVM